MNLSRRIVPAVAALCLSGPLWAQPGPGYQVSWGAHDVPLSPWLSVLIALMLVLATYAFMRRRAGRGVMLLAGTLLVGGLLSYTEKSALSLIGPTTTLATPSGSVTLYCDQTHYLGTTVVGGVTLTVTPFGMPPDAGQAAVPSGVMTPECATGTHLNPGQLCFLCVS